MRIALAVVAITLVASGAAAQDEPNDARVLFDRGVERADQERWGEAVELFRRSFAVAERPSTAFNLAGALLRLGQPTAALDALQDYLRVAPQDDPHRAETRDLTELALAAIAHVDLRVDPPEARLRVDGRVAAGDGEARSLRLDPGEHHMRLEADGRVPSSFTVSLRDGERASRSVALEVVTEPTGPAQLRITSDQARAQILVDHEVVGRGTYVSEIEAGGHLVEVRAEGFEAFVRSVELGAAERRDIQATLAPIVVRPLAEEPALWITVALVVLGGVATSIVIAAASGDDAPYGGTTDVVLFGMIERF